MDDGIVDKLTVKILKVRNGYILKTSSGQFVFQDFSQMIESVKNFYSGK